MNPPLLFSSIISITFFVLLAAIFFRISIQINSKGFFLLFLSALFLILITFFIPKNIDLANILESISEFIFTAGLMVLVTLENEKIWYLLDLIKKKKMKDLLFKKAPQMIELNKEEISKKYMNLLVVIGLMSLIFPLICYFFKEKIYVELLIIIVLWLVMVVYYFYKIREK